MTLKVKTALWWLTIVFCSACSGDDFFDSEVFRHLNADSLVLLASRNHLIADGVASIELDAQVYDSKGQLIKEVSPQLFLGDEPLGSTFSTDIPGNYLIHTAISGMKREVVFRARPVETFPVVEIPVIFHIIHRGEPIGEGRNLTDEQVVAIFNNLNKDFRNMKGSEDPNAVDTFIQFKLATVDPDGIPLESPGIERIQAPFNQSNISFRDEWLWDYFWDPDFYINIWVGTTSDGYSWGTFPYLDCDHLIPGLSCAQTNDAPGLQGAILNTQAAGPLSSVLAHEIGHVLGLPHTFTRNHMCNAYDDYCEDTPAYDLDDNENFSVQQSLFRGCNGEVFESHNYMDYYVSRNTFTYDQRARMRHVLQYGKWRGLKAMTIQNGRRSGKPKQMIRPLNSSVTSPGDNIVVCTGL